MQQRRGESRSLVVVSTLVLSAAIILEGLGLWPASRIPTTVGPCLLAILAALSCSRAGRNSAGAERLIWAFFFVASGLTALAQALLLHARWRGFDLTKSEPVSYGLWAVLYYFVFVGFYLTAFLKPHQHPTRTVRPAVVVDTLLLALLLLGWHFYFTAAYHVNPGDQSRKFAGLLFVLVLGGGAAVGLVSCRLRAPSPRWKAIYGRMALAVALQAVSEATSIWLRGSHGSVPAWLADADDLLETVAFAFVALAAARPVELPSLKILSSESPVVSVWRELSIPSLVLVGLLGIPLLDNSFAVTAESLRLRNATLSFASGLYVLLLLARQFLVQMENRDLALDLQQESARLRLLLSNIQDAVITEDLDGRVVFANDRFLEMFGLSPSRIPHLRLEEFIHPEDRRLRWAAHDPLLGDSLGPTRFEFRGVRKDGAILYLESSIAPVRPGGMILGYQSVIRDITERRKAEEKQRELAQRLEFLVSRMPLGCIIFDLDFRILEWNESASRIFGWTATEAFERNGLELLAPPELWPSSTAVWKDLARSKSSNHNFSQNLTKGRGAIECEWFNTSLIDEGGHVVAVASMVQDVTERKNLEAQLRQSQKMEAVGVLAGGVAHDFNNLLTVIVGNVSLALMRLSPENPAARGLHDAEKAAERATELVQKLLGFSRKSPSSPRAISVNACVRETVELLSRAVDPRIVIEIHEQPDLWPVAADAGQMHQVLMNLCVNAKDAMENGGRLTITTANRTVDSAYCRLRPDARAGEFVEICVSDTGCGMDRATLPRIFEPFFTTKQVGKGTGLGLAMVYGIVKQHEGWITVESEPGKGSQFRVFLPRSQTAAEKETQAPVAVVAPGSETILLVDDEEMIRNLARGILESKGHRIVEARDGEEAVQIFEKSLSGSEQSRIDLVLLDMVMPRKSGRDALIELRRLAPQVPVVLASGYASDAPDDLAALGARTFIRKPYRPDELTRVIREVLDAVSSPAAPRP